MKFGLFMLPCFREGVAPSLADFYDEMSELVVRADQTEWDRVWISEHHFHYYGGTAPNPAVQLSAWARETKHIRLGPAISLMPLRNPLHVAEDYATTRLSLKRHPVAFLRDDLEAEGVTVAADLAGG